MVLILLSVDSDDVGVVLLELVNLLAERYQSLLEIV